MRSWPKLALMAVFALAVGGAVAGAAVARSSSVPQNTSPPTIGGTLKEGSTLTASDGTWSNSPTSFAYQWQRCNSGGAACGDITAGTSKTYTPTSGDVGHALRVVVTGSNTDGKSSATSDATDPVSSKNGPANTVKPALGGAAVVGDTLRVTNGSWSPTPTSFSRQWQRCGSDGSDCSNISGANGQTYGVGSADTGHRLRALVTARTSSGATTAATSPSAVVSSTTTTTTVTTTTTTTGNRAPSLAFISLRRSGVRVFARFRICDDRTGRIRVTERDNKNRVLSATRHWRVSLNSSCAVYAKSCVPRKAFRTRGRYVVTLRATDAQGRLSVLRSRALVRR